MALAASQVDALLQPLHPSRVRSVQGNAHLEAWDVRRHLLRVFGWGGWDFQVIACDLVSERSKWDEQNPLKGRHTVVYRCLGRLVIKDPEGNVLACFEDGATGDAANQPSLGDAHDMAMKTAMSQALKRCAMNLGDRFGLGLYNGGKTDAVVGKSLAHASAEIEATDDVSDGELAEPKPEVERGPAPEADVFEAPEWAVGFRTRLSKAMTPEALRDRWTEVSEAAKNGEISPEWAGTFHGEITARKAHLEAEDAKPEQVAS